MIVTMITSRECLNCGKQFTDHLRRGRTPRYCSDRCRAASNRAVVPEVMRCEDRWVSYAWPSRQPLQLNGKPASATDPATWASYSRVRSCPAKGYVLGGNIGAAEFFRCLDPTTGMLMNPVVAGIVELLCDKTYIEVSRSGDGLTVFGIANEDRGWSRDLPGGLRVAFHSREHIVTVTGQRWSSTSKLYHLRRHLSHLEPAHA